MRLLAATGVLAPRAHEQLELLALLVKDADADVVAAAESTLQSIPVEPLGAFLARKEVSAELRAFFEARGVGVATAAAPAESDAPLIDAAPEPAPVAEDEDTQTTHQRIAAMSVAQRVGVAMKGSREERAILIRDPNRIVTAAVLSSPKMTETEAAAIAKMQNVSEDVLRTIAHNRAWLKNYSVVLAVVKNPKTPVALSMNLMARLSEKDLKLLSTDRNVPDALRGQARRKITGNDK
jgi:hypothetical protein